MFDKMTIAQENRKCNRKSECLFEILFFSSVMPITVAFVVMFLHIVRILLCFIFIIG